jgi:hypothetical protein
MTVRPEANRPRLIHAVAGTLFAVLYAVLMSTGALTLVLVVTAAMRGGSVTDLFYDVFPRFRGGPQMSHIPAYVYAVFIAYVTLASTIAIERRRSLVKKWQQRHR